MTSKNDWLISVSGVDMTGASPRPFSIPGNFQTFTGGNGKAEINRDWPGGATKPIITAGPTDYEDFTIERTLGSSADNTMIESLRKQIGVSRFTVTKQLCDVNKRALGKATVYPDCILNSISEPEAESGSADQTKWSLTFSHTGPA